MQGQIAALLESKIEIQDEGFRFGPLRKELIDTGRQQFTDTGGSCANRCNLARKNFAAHCAFSSPGGRTVPLLRRPRATPATSSGRKR